MYVIICFLFPYTVDLPQPFEQLLFLKLGDNCIVFENFMTSIGDLMVTN
jgi:hypothetical protein